MNANFLRRIGRAIAAFVVALHYGCAPTQSADSYAGYENKTSDVSLFDTDWGLFTIGDKRVDSASGQQQANITLHSHDQSLAGFTGCNSLGGQYQLDGDRLSFERLRHTKRGCRDGQRQENAMLQALQATAFFRLQGNQLILYDADERERLRFTAAQAKN